MALSQDTLDLIGKILGIRKEKGPLKEEKFAFFLSSYPEETFGVVNFNGQESLGQCYQFDINLVSRTHGLDLDLLLRQEAALLIKRENQHPVAFHGILSSIEQYHQAQGFTFYRARLSPKLWYLNLIHHNRIFLKRTVLEILEEVLKDMFPVVLNFEFRLQGDYSRILDYVCQYEETHFQFLSRWLEREGLYYFFELTDVGEKMIITDTHLSHADIPQESVLRYREPSGLTGAWKEIVTNFNCRSTPVAQRVLLKDHNYRKPALDLTGRSVIHPEAQWECHYFGDHFQTPEEGDRLARIRSEGLRCRQKTFHGKSTSPFLRPGFKFQLVGHYEKHFNGTYLITDVTHKGSQIGFLVSGLKKEVTVREQDLLYQNTFTAIPIDLPFRPPRVTEKPRIHGVISARIDAAGSGQIAEMDEWGRYKVILPFDLSGRQGGKASAWLRLAQPFVGENHGMHFPLHKGTEVLLTFVDGDPDRPIIASAVPDLDHPSVVNSKTATRSGFRTSSGAGLVIEDLKNKEKMVLRSGDGKSQITMGRGSPVETVIASDNLNFICNMLKFDLNFGQTVFSFNNSQTLAGFKKYQLLYMAVHKLLLKHPDLNFATYLGGGSVTEVLTPVGLLVNSLVSLGIKKVFLKFQLDMPYGVYDKFNIKSSPSILLGKLKDGLIFDMTKGLLSDNDDIVLVNEVDDIRLLAAKNVGIAARQGDITLSCRDKFQVSGREETAIDSPLINLTAEPKLVGAPDCGIKITAKEGDLEFMTKNSGTIKIGHEPGLGGGKSPELSIASNGKVTLEGATEIELNADTQVTIKVGGSSIMLNPTEVHIETKNEVSINGAQVKANGLTVSQFDLKYKGDQVNLADALRIFG